MPYNPMPVRSGAVPPLRSLPAPWSLVLNSPRETKNMLKSNYRETISSAVAYINSIPEVEDMDVNRVKLGVVLRLLNAAGWDVFDVSQVMPDYPTGNGKVDFALTASASRRAGGPATPQVLVKAKPFGENLESGRYERRLVAHCVREGAPLAALTNGRRWLLLF